MKRFDVLTVPCGAEYSALLDAAAAERFLGTLVIRQDLPYSEAARAIRSRILETDGLSYSASEWPGTRLSGSHAEVLVFSVGRAAELLRATDRLYGWRRAQLPEDLCLYRPDGSLALMSCAHEEFAEVYLRQEDVGMHRCVAGWRLAELPAVPLLRLDAATASPAWRR